MSWEDPSQIVPLADRVFVETVSEEQVRGGIIVPDMAQGRPDRAHVIAVGPGRLHPKTGELVPVSVKPGDEILFHRHAGTAVGGFEHDNYVIFREEDILAIVLPSTEDDSDLREPMV